MVSKVSNVETRKKRETSAWQQRSIACSKLEIDFESRWSNAIWLATVEHSKLCDTISFAKLYMTILWTCHILYCSSTASLRFLLWRKGFVHAHERLIPKFNTKYQNQQKLLFTFIPYAKVVDWCHFVGLIQTHCLWSTLFKLKALTDGSRDLYFQPKIYLRITHDIGLLVWTACVGRSGFYSYSI